MIFDRTYEYSLTEGELDIDFEFPQACSLLTVYIKASAPIREEVSINFRSALGANYDTLIERRKLQDEQNYVYAAVGTMAINEEDKVNVNVTNANALGVVRVTVKART